MGKQSGKGPKARSLFDKLDDVADLSVEHVGAPTRVASISGNFPRLNVDIAGPQKPPASKNLDDLFHGIADLDDDEEPDHPMDATRVASLSGKFPELNLDGMGDLGDLDFRQQQAKKGRDPFGGIADFDDDDEFVEDPRDATRVATVSEKNVSDLDVLGAVSALRLENKPAEKKTLPRPVDLLAGVAGLQKAQGRDPFGGIADFEDEDEFVEDPRDATRVATVSEKNVSELNLDDLGAVSALRLENKPAEKKTLPRPIDLLAGVAGLQKAQGRRHSPFDGIADLEDEDESVDQNPLDATRVASSASFPRLELNKQDPPKKSGLDDLFDDLEDLEDHEESDSSLSLDDVADLDDGYAHEDDALASLPEFEGSMGSEAFAGTAVADAPSIEDLVSTGTSDEIEGSPANREAVPEATHAKKPDLFVVIGGAVVVLLLILWLVFFRT